LNGHGKPWERAADAEGGVEMRNAAAVYSVIVGISMVAMWTVSYITDGIPEIHTEPTRIGVHITAETATALTLIVGGLGLLAHRRRGFQVYLLSMGMLLYTLIQSPGYFAQRGEWAFAGMFAILIAIALTFVALSFLRPDEFNPTQHDPEAAGSPAG
jgi:peptidoglycan/LPS O-acetylase OafA/YrhL